MNGNSVLHGDAQAILERDHADQMRRLARERYPVCTAVASLLIVPATTSVILGAGHLAQRS